MARIAPPPEQRYLEDGLTLLRVEQKLLFARRVADEFRILDTGRRVAQGRIDEHTDEIVNTDLGVRLKA